MCAHFGWTWDYLHHGISWPVLQRVMIDLPSYDFNDKKDEDEIKLNKENASAIMNFINGNG